MNIESEPRVRSVRFGDGYEQRRPDGFNTNLEKYSVTLSPKNTEAQVVRAFLEKHAGVTAFLWKPPHQMNAIKVLCNGHFQWGHLEPMLPLNLKRFWHKTD